MVLLGSARFVFRLAHTAASTDSVPPRTPLTRPVSPLARTRADSEPQAASRPAAHFVIAAGKHSGSVAAHGVGLADQHLIALRLSYTSADRYCVIERVAVLPAACFKNGPNSATESLTSNAAPTPRFRKFSRC